MRSVHPESDENPLPCLKKLREVLVRSMARATDWRDAYEFEKQLAAIDLLIQKIQERRKKPSHSLTYD